MANSAEFPTFLQAQQQILCGSLANTHFTLQTLSESILMFLQLLLHVLKRTYYTSPPLDAASLSFGSVANDGFEKSSVQNNLRTFNVLDHLVAE